MIERRQFLGSVAAFCVATTSLPRVASASTSSIDLNWQSTVIETIAHSSAERNPVVTDVSLQPGGSQLAIVGDDHFVCIYDTQANQYIQHLGQHTDWIRTARYSPNGSRLATAGNDRTMLIWSTENWLAPAISKRNPEAIIELAFTHDGTKIATVGFESKLRLFDVQSGDEMRQFELPCPDNHAVAFSNDDRYVAAGGRSGTVRVWDMQSGRKHSEFKAHRQRIRSLDFTSDGKIVSASDDQFVKITDPANPTNIQSFRRHASKLYATALLGGDLIATGGSDNKIHIWQLKTKQELGTLSGHTGTVSCLDYSKSQLVSGSFDTHVRLWRTEQNTSAPDQRHTELGDGWNRSLK
ncbi:MAG: WD40 repeat protein [Mariniblastus sp.]|jgi:WD40 repeat protein